MKYEKEITDPLDIVNFLIQSAHENGIKTSVSKSVEDAEIKIETITLSENRVFNN